MIKSWMVIGAVTMFVNFGSFLIRPKSDIKWFRDLRLPDWLVFEPAIPLIWTVIFICGAISATVVWETDPGSLRTWLLMGLYLLVEIVTVAYIPTTLRTRSLKAGTIVGASGLFLCIVLTLAVLPTSGWAAFLLVPYLIWSPVGTLTTWEMVHLNPEAA